MLKKCLLLGIYAVLSSLCLCVVFPSGLDPHDEVIPDVWKSHCTLVRDRPTMCDKSIARLLQARRNSTTNSL